MKKQRRSLRKDKKGFTGLEAAIVLTAFVVVAAVFSYVVLNAGFFTSQKSEEVVHTGIAQVTSSFEPAGDIIAHGWQYGQDDTGYYFNDSANATSDYALDSTNLTVVLMYLTLTAGEKSMDMDKLSISYTDLDTHEGALTHAPTVYTTYDGIMPNETTSLNVSKCNMSMSSWTYYTANTPGATHNRMLEAGEKVVVLITLPDYGVTANKPFTIELKPAIGPVITIPRVAPGQIDETMNLH